MRAVIQDREGTSKTTTCKRQDMGKGSGSEGGRSAIGLRGGLPLLSPDTCQLWVKPRETINQPLMKPRDDGANKCAVWLRTV